MNAESFFAEFYPFDSVTYHGDASCEYSVGATFECTSCKRTICYCGGHDGAGTIQCRRNCSKCDECCRG